ncbi:NlpC/P60 family protein [Desulfosporosinus sp. Sb-LF]|uniref:C40 family peptidase n=1 Tax=Desulfosporosinus sp. Sb-LF TaxID=2560027 RepID=UPI00107FB6A2|nr:NlpC/P60 family protein [Desulfosporosinus sp. Sb-LF]TGE33981.1 hydrolase [Desulfosporosinus sp. Sb-LF]
MKKGFMLAIILTILLFSAPNPAQASLGDSLLKLGSTGGDVVELQKELNDLGFNVEKVDGIFGSMTKQCVISYQQAHSLASDGIVGPLTAQSINTVYVEKQRQNKIVDIISTAKQNLGVRYQWGGAKPETGFDCSGFVSYVFGQNGISLPRISRDQFTVGTGVNYEDLQPGDLVFFSLDGDNIVDHVGIYLGNGQFINASSSKGVTVYTIGPYWKSYYVGARRVL